MGQNVNILFRKLQYNEKRIISQNYKTRIYIGIIAILTIMLSGIIALYYPKGNINIGIKVISFLLLLIPVSEFIVQITQYILSKIVRPK